MKHSPPQELTALCAASCICCLIKCEMDTHHSLNSILHEHCQKLNAFACKTAGGTEAAMPA